MDRWVARSSVVRLAEVVVIRRPFKCDSLMHIPIDRRCPRRPPQPSSAWATRSSSSCATLGVQFKGSFKGLGLYGFGEARLRDGDHRRGLLPLLRLHGGW